MDSRWIDCGCNSDESVDCVTVSDLVGSANYIVSGSFPGVVMSEEKEIKEIPVNTPSQTPKKSRWKLVLLGLVILFCGMVIGAGITFHVGHVMIFHAISPNGEMAGRITKQIDRDLNLTDEQRSQVDKIVAHRVSAFGSILIEAYPKIKEQFELLHDEVAPILTEEQKLKWEKHYEKMQKVIKKIHKRLPPDSK
ncbi:MAG: hypothetical protein HY730_06475 [Candidatus Tectomicrobia bacterium]|uniref:Periplasmic heavy metal sensor n=1 Tax=Tectimicrobiota bacterium TaxID=2528274 RepID=A0A933LQB4_UNCTE|nr:hypothetical protein [Candidatus Tectomicrobia bacterium]